MPKIARRVAKILQLNFYPILARMQQRAFMLKVSLSRKVSYRVRGRIMKYGSVSVATGVAVAWFAAAMPAAVR